MGIKLPINPRVRESIAKRCYKPDADGLYKDTLFSSIDLSGYIPDGSAFVLNYERFCAGELTDDQADKVLIEALKHMRIAHLKVIHPQLDIGGMIMHLVRERFEKTNNQELKDLCIQKRDSEPLHARNTQMFEMLKGVLVTHATKIAPMAIALGQSKDLVLKHLVGVIDESLTALDITAERCPHIRTGFLHHFLIAYPELWDQTNTEPYHFLGELMIHMSPIRGMDVDKTVAHGQAGKSLIRRPSVTPRNQRKRATAWMSPHNDLGGIPISLMEFTLDYLADIDPDVLDARHLLREGTRSAVWLDRCKNLESGLPILERLLAYGIFHPALERIEGVVAKLSEAGKRAALLCYANGGEIHAEMAQAIVDTAPQVYDQVLDQVKKFTAIHRLADLKWPSNEQLLKLSPKNKRLLLEDDLGI